LPDDWPTHWARLPMDLCCHVLPEPLNLRYLALHGSQHGWSRLKWLVDFAALLARIDPSQRSALYRTTRTCEGRRALGQAMILCEDMLALPLDPQLRRLILSDRRNAWLVGIARHCAMGSGARELEEVRFGSTAKNLGHYLLSMSPAYLLAEARFDLGDMTGVPGKSGLHRLGPAGRLIGWLSRQRSLPPSP
jgi:hypothetical protein